MSIETTKPQVSALLVAIGHYDEKYWAALDQAPKAALELAKLFQDGGYNQVHPELLDGGVAKDIISLLGTSLRNAGDRDTIVLYWTGHGKTEGDGHFLITQDSPSNNFASDNAIRSSELGAMAAKSPAEKILIILDTCYSGAGAGEVVRMARTVLASRSQQPGRIPAFVVMASALPLAKADETIFCNALIKVLGQPLASNGSWTDNDQFIGAGDLAKAIHEMTGEDVDYVASGYDSRFIPNPRYRGELPAEDVETRQRRLEQKEHFLPASQGIETGEVGWYFSGRTRLLRELVNWFKHADHGLVVVTGPVGSGKSAVLGRLAALSAPASRTEAEGAGILASAAVETLPPPGIIDMALHLKGKTLFDSIGAVASAIGIALTDRERADARTLVGKVGSLNRRVTLLFDALDEAMPGHPHSIGERLIKPLAALPQVRVLVGTRRSPDGATVSASEPRHKRLQELFGTDTNIFDLEDELETSADIAQYVRSRLRDSRHRNDVEGIERAAAAITRKSAGIFLYARIGCRMLRDVGQLDIELPEDALGVFVEDLTRRFGDQTGMVNDLLAALAWGEGKGLTRRVWAPIASTLSRTGASYRDGDVAWVLGHAGWHILEAGEDGQAVYRLAHQAFADHYRRGVDPTDAHARITEALAEGTKGKDWLGADAYLWRHLASHAAVGRVLDVLVLDPGYLAVAEPIRLQSALATLVDKDARAIASIYRRVAHELPRVDPLGRMALIHLAACQEMPSLAPRLKPVLSTGWCCRWAHWIPTGPYRLVGYHEGGRHGQVRAVALGAVDDRPVVVSGSADSTVRLWDARTGKPRGEPLMGHTDWVMAVALGYVDGEPVVVSGGSDGMIRLWNARTGQPRGTPLTSHRYLVPIEGGEVHQIDPFASEVDDQMMAGWGVERKGWLWDKPTHKSSDKPRLMGYTGGPHTVALCEVDGEPVMVSAGDDGTIRLWDARAGQPRGQPLYGHSGRIMAGTLGEVDDEPVVVSAGQDGTVRLWDVRTGKPRGEPLTGNTSWVSAVALSRIDGEPVVVSGGWDSTVRLWDARTGKSIGKPLTGHTGTVTGVALGEVNGKPVVVSAGQDGTVRLWDARSGKPRGQPLMGHTDEVTAVALGYVDGEPVVVSGGRDSTVRLWDVRSEKTLDEPLIGHESDVSAVALGYLDGEAVVVSGGTDSTVRLWDPRTGESLGKPLTSHTRTVYAVAVGKVDSEVVAVSDGLKVRLWNTRTGESHDERLLGPRKTEWSYSVALGYVDGEPVVAFGGKESTVWLWDARTGKLRMGPLSGHQAWIFAVALGEVDDEPVVVSAGQDQTVRLWDVRTGMPRGEPLKGNSDSVTAVALSQLDGEPVAVSACEDGTVRLWDARTGKSRGKPLMGHIGTVTAVALGEVNGKPVVVSAGHDGTVRLWDARSYSLSRIVPLGLGILVTGFAMVSDATVAVSTNRGLLMLDFFLSHE